MDATCIYVTHVFVYAQKASRIIRMLILCLPFFLPEWGLWIQVHSRTHGTLCEKASMASENCHVYSTWQLSQNRNLCCPYSCLHRSVLREWWGCFKENSGSSQNSVRKDRRLKTCPHSLCGSSANPLWICCNFLIVEAVLNCSVTTNGLSISWAYKDIFE